MLRSREAGVTLIEVLIAVLVLAVGMIGTIALQGTAKRGNFEALQRTQAVLIAKDIAERIASNGQPGTFDSYAGTYSGNMDAPGKSCLGSGTECTPAELASWDSYQFDQAILGASQQNNSAKNVGSMVDAVGCITNANGLITIVITWRGISLSKAATSPISGCGSDIPESERRQHVYRTFI